MNSLPERILLGSLSCGYNTPHKAVVLGEFVLFNAGIAYWPGTYIFATSGRRLNYWRLFKFSQRVQRPKPKSPVE